MREGTYSHMLDQAKPRIDSETARWNEVIADPTLHDRDHKGRPYARANGVPDWAPVSGVISSEQSVALHLVRCLEIGNGSEGPKTPFTTKLLLDAGTAFEKSTHFYKVQVNPQTRYGELYLQVGDSSKCWHTELEVYALPRYVDKD